MAFSEAGPLVLNACFWLTVLFYEQGFLSVGREARLALFKLGLLLEYFRPRLPKLALFLELNLV